LSIEEAGRAGQRFRRRVYLALDDALEDLTKIYPRKSKVVELKFFGRDGGEANLRSSASLGERRSCAIGILPGSGSPRASYAKMQPERSEWLAELVEHGF